MNLKSSLPSRQFYRISTSLFISLCLLCLPNITRAEEKPRLSAYIETFPEGRIDWENGIIYGVGIGYLNQNQNSKNKALRAAQLIAQQSVLKVAARIRLNDEHSLESLEKDAGGIHLKATMRTSDDSVVFEPSGNQPHIKVTLKAPITGIDGLTINLLNQLKQTSQRWKSFPKPSARDSFDIQEAPWLLLDGRRLMAQNTLKPALFPKIVSTAGQTIYDLDNVDEKALINHGMARYAVSELTPEQLLSQDNTSANRLADFFQKLFISEAYAGENKKKRKRRKYIVSEVKQAQGIMKTNLIISENDARKITAEDGSSRILKECRVIILISSPVGGIEGSIPHYLALTL